MYLLRFLKIEEFKNNILLSRVFEFEASFYLEAVHAITPTETAFSLTPGGQRNLRCGGSENDSGLGKVLTLGCYHINYVFVQKIASISSSHSRSPQICQTLAVM
jgi:hypothetical protein